MGIRYSAVLGVLALLSLACGCGQDASPPTTTGRVLAVHPSSCPPTAPAVQPTTRPGLAAQLVPAGPVQAAVCRYEGLDGPGVAHSLARSHVVVGAALDQLVTLFNSPRWNVVNGPATYSCPNDDGSLDVVVFVYPSGPPVEVSVDLAGCTFASNGVRTVDGHALGQHLDPLVGSRTGT